MPAIGEPAKNPSRKLLMQKLEEWIESNGPIKGWRSQTISVIMVPAPHADARDAWKEDVESQVSGDFAMDCRQGREYPWIVTHVPTGRMIGWFKSAVQAERFIAAIHTLTDWHSIDEESMDSCELDLHDFVCCIRSYCQHVTLLLCVLKFMVRYVNRIRKGLRSKPKIASSSKPRRAVKKRKRKKYK